MIKIKEIAFSCYPVTDVAKARDFYQNVLGLKPSLTFEHEGMAWVEYDLPNGTLAITNMGSETWKPSKHGGSVALEVEDFQEALAAVREANVPLFTEPMESPGCHMVVLSDPDGNAVVLHRRKG